MQSLPDKFADSIFHYVSFLSFANMEKVKPEPDELRSMRQFNRSPKTLKWDQVRHLL